MKDKPTIFIASSSEASSVAEAVHVKLDNDFGVKLWENAFELSSITITSLIKEAQEVDYAVFVFHEDDKIVIRGNEYSSVRDNVVLELGIFIGALGLEKCFIIAPRSTEIDFRLPTDLAGVTASFYDDTSGDLFNAVTASCAKLKQAVNKIEVQKMETKATSEESLLKQQLTQAQSQVWSLGHDMQRAKEQVSQLHESIKHYFFSVAKPATPAEIKAWEEGAKESYLKDVQVSGRKAYYVDSDVIIPPLYGANSISIIVAPGVKIYGVEKLSHNSIYYMDGFRADSLI